MLKSQKHDSNTSKNNSRQYVIQTKDKKRTLKISSIWTDHRYLKNSNNDGMAFNNKSIYSFTASISIHNRFF